VDTSTIVIAELTAVQDLVQTSMLSGREQSPFNNGYRFLLEQGVPVIGGGYDGVYGDPGNENIISATRTS
jgi:hypothetical protein